MKFKAELNLVGQRKPHILKKVPLIVVIKKFLTKIEEQENHYYNHIVLHSLQDEAVYHISITSDGRIDMFGRKLGTFSNTHLFYIDKQSLTLYRDVATPEVLKMATIIFEYHMQKYICSELLS